jgi:ribosomal protein S18 acetylase RimI-like enzyme
MGDQLRLEHFDAADARQIAGEAIVPIYEASHAEDLANPFHSVERFLERFDAYTQRDGFEMVVGYADESTPVGLAFGFPLPDGTRWWRGLITPVPNGFTAENGRRTFAVNEIMVHPDWQRRGVARTVHSELLSRRPEERATLLVEPDNEPAQAAYSRWGYRKVGELKPFEDAPTYDAMVLELPGELA